MAKILNPKERAIKLKEAFTINCMECADDCQAIQLACIAVDELIDEHNFKSPIPWNAKRQIYWKAVKRELELLKVNH